MATHPLTPYLNIGTQGRVFHEGSYVGRIHVAPNGHVTALPSRPSQACKSCESADEAIDYLADIELRCNPQIQAFLSEQ